MCGINGFTWRDEGLIAQMNHVIRYRGPDDKGTFTDEKLSLGSTRLAILDLSENGHMPMPNHDQSLWITYNGEVYNFQDIREDLLRSGYPFKSRSDTEVILHAYEVYGLECFKRFNGMWAFALYDKKKDILILSRDRFGVKPLYYYSENGRLIFSSMITAILCHPVKTAPNQKNIMEYLAFNLEHHRTETFFENIYSLLPGHTIIYDFKSGEHKIERWYIPEPKTTENPTETIKQLFIDSVKLRTISDVPVGVCLSGGVDSTAITCVLNQHLTAIGSHSNTFNTYSMVVPGKPMDESRYIKEVGRLTNTEQFFTTVPLEDFPEQVEDFIAAHEEPVTSLSPFAQYTVFKMAHQHGAKVLLDGQGGDELFGGYTYYLAYYFYELFANLRWLTLIKEMTQVHHKLGGWFAQRLFFFLLLPDGLRRFLWKRNVVPWINHNLLEQTCGNEEDPRWSRLTFKQIQPITLHSTSIPHLLRWEDKGSMRWSIESRVPFLDYRLVETALALPTEAFLKNGETKQIFKRAMSDILPEMIRNRKDKIGYAPDTDNFFRDEKIINFAKEILYSKSFKARPYWNWKVVEQIFQNHQKGKVNAGDVIWKWINLELWLRMYFEANKSDGDVQEVL